jgi:RNA polymerase sigma-70 factor (ECF subfamily)
LAPLVRHTYDGSRRKDVTVNEQSWQLEQFERYRPHLQAVAYRMLGSVTEADDALQEAWIRLSRANTDDVDNLGGWLTTVVARVSLDMLRSRRSRREDSLAEEPAKPVAGRPDTADPEQEAVLADSVGLALLVVLENLTPTERLAFVLHDLFGMSFDDISPIVGRSPAAARQLASRARRRVRGRDAAANADVKTQRQVVEAFLAAAREGNFDALLGVLDPAVVRRADAAALPPGAPRELRGAEAVAQGALAGARRAGSPPVALALINGKVGVVVAPHGRLTMAMQFETRDARIVAIEIVADPDRLRGLDVALLD